MADARPKPERSPSRCHIITYDKISDERRIASGSFGVVYEAQHEDWGQVAIKKPIRITSITDKERCELEAEAAKMVDVRSLNIVTLFGVVIDPSHYCLVLEYMCHGSMKTFQSKFDNPWPMKICMIYNIVLGMNYLHETANIVHRDLKVDNVLVGEGFKAKISDFGLATWKKYTQKYSIMNCIESTCSYMGTTSHIPPENLRDVNKAADYKFDVYSFAVTLWEIVTNETPYKNAQNHEHLMGAVMHGQRPDIKLIPPECLDVIRNVMEACWDDDPQKRPSFGDLKKKIEICKKENEDAILDALGYLNKQLRDSPKISHTSLPSAKFVNDNNCNGVDRIDQRSNNGAMFTMVEQDNLKNTSTSDYSKKKTNGAMTNGTVTNVRRDTNDTHCHYKDKSTQHEINNISNSFPVLFKEVAATIESHTLGLSEEELKRVLENAHRDDMINEWEINQDSHIFTIRGDLRQMNDIHFKLQEIVQSENPSTTCSLSNASELDTMHTKNLSSTPVRDKRVEQSIQKSPIKGHRGDNLPKLLMVSQTSAQIGTQNSSLDVTTIKEINVDQKLLMYILNVYADELKTYEREYGVKFGNSRSSLLISSTQNADREKGFNKAYEQIEIFVSYLKQNVVARNLDLRGKDVNSDDIEQAKQRTKEVHEHILLTVNERGDVLQIYGETRNVDAAVNTFSHAIDTSSLRKRDIKRNVPKTTGLDFISLSDYIGRNKQSQVVSDGITVKQSHIETDSSADCMSRHADGRACLICMNMITNLRILQCNHVLCMKCVREKSTDNQTYCPSCKQDFGIITGNMPEGEMEYNDIINALGVKLIRIKYTFLSGIQGELHPNPGTRYAGNSFVSYLYDNDEGRTVLRLLKSSFDRHLTFSVGKSNTVVTNEIEHWIDSSKRELPWKSRLSDYNKYLCHVKEDLAALGVV